MSDPAHDRQLSDLNALLGVSRELGATIELLPLLHKVEHAVRQVLRCERGTVFLFDQSCHELYSLVATGDEQIRFSAKLGIAGESLQTRSLINVPDAYADARFNSAIDRATGYRTRNLLTFPMMGHDGKSVGILQALNKHVGGFDSSDEQRAADLGSLAGVAIQRQMLLNEYAQKQQLDSDLALARDIQQSLLPKNNPVVEGYEIAGWNNPADATGGDCFDYVELECGRLIGILLADVTGHGVGPALLASECRALVRALASSSSDPAGILIRANHLLTQDLDSGRFVTTFFGVLDPSIHIIRYLSAGQGPLLHYQRATGHCREIAATTYPLGIVSEIDVTTCQILAMQPGDIFVLATDGFFEWADPSKEQFGAHRVAEAIHAHRDCTPEQIIRELHRRVVDFGRGAPQEDDITAVIVKRNP